MPGIPQLYYGTELLMHGTKQRSDGDIRLDVPGGWPGDKQDQFTANGRSTLQNEAFGFLQKLLKWRKGNAVLAQGKMKHYVLQKGVYVYERYLNDQSVWVLMNGTSKGTEIDLARYAESVRGRQTAKDILSGKQVSLGDKLTLSPKQIYILE